MWMTNFRLFWRNYRFSKCLLFAGPAHFNYNICSYLHMNMSLWVLHHDCKEHFFTIQLFVRTIDFEHPKKISKNILWFSCNIFLKFLRVNRRARVFQCRRIDSSDSKDIFGLLDLEDNSQIDLYRWVWNHRKIREKSMVFVFLCWKSLNKT